MLIRTVEDDRLAPIFNKGDTIIVDPQGVGTLKMQAVSIS